MNDTQGFAGGPPVLPGRAERGLAIFCGGIRWFGVRWGRWSLPTGLRQAGFDGQILYWPWHGRWRFPPCELGALWDRSLHERQAAAVAAHAAAFRCRQPTAPLYLLGCSAGAWVALRALELLPAGVWANAAAMFSAAVAPDHDLGPALARLTGPLVNSHSLGDFLILGLGTVLLGTADRRHCLSAGMVGLRGGHGQVVNVPWTPQMLSLGRMVGHATATAPRYVARVIAPRMGIGRGAV